MATAIALLALTGVPATAYADDFANSVPEEKAVEEQKFSQLIRGIQRDLAVGLNRVRLEFPPQPG
jgi:hypothetical protein